MPNSRPSAWCVEAFSVLHLKDTFILQWKKKENVIHSWQTMSQCSEKKNLFKTNIELNHGLIMENQIQLWIFENLDPRKK